MKQNTRAFRHIGGVAVAVALTLAAAGCGSGSDSDSDRAAKATNDAGDTVAGGTAKGKPASATGTLMAEAQDSDGTSITVSAVKIDGAPGWIAVHSDVNGAPGPVIGQVKIKEGTASDVKVKLDKPLDSDAVVWPMLHVDDSKLGAYEFPGVKKADLPVTEGGKPVMMKIDVTVG